MRKLLTLFVPLILALAVSGMVRAASGPQEVVKQTTDQLLKAIEGHQDNIQEVEKLVRKIVLPQVDSELMARFVLGRYWRTASQEQRKKFTEEFTTLLVRTYAKPLTSYNGQAVQYDPLQGDQSKGRVAVPTHIAQKDGPSVPITYRMHKGDDTWMVYDVVIEGVSLVQNYRTSWGDQISRNGLDALIKQLGEKNKQAHAGQG